MRPRRRGHEKVPLCPACRADAGWVYTTDGAVFRCDHGELQARVEAAEAADAARRSRARYDREEQQEG